MKNNYKGKQTNIPYVDVPGEVEGAPDGLYPWLKGLSLLPRTAEFNIERPSIDFISERANYGSVTQTKAVTFTFDLRNAKPLSSAYMRFTANGDAVSFSNFAQMNGSLDFNAGVGELNIIFFFYDGTTAWYYIPHGTAPTGGGSVTANHGNVAYVATGGNDGTGIMGNISKPFLTAQAALAAMDANNPGTIIILSSASPQTIDDVSYSDGDCPENLTIKDLCSCGIIFTGTILFYTLFLETQTAITINTATQWNVDDYYNIQCSAFVVPDTMAGVILAVTGHIDCDNFLIAENASASIVLDVVVWSKGAAIGVIDAFSYNDITPWEYEALLNQVDTSPPTASVDKNTFGETLTYAYVNPGEYTITSPGSKFVLNKTYIYFGAGRYDGGGLTTLGTTAALAVDEINFAVYSPFSFAFDNNQLLNTPVNIKVYPAKY